MNSLSIFFFFPFRYCSLDCCCCCSPKNAIGESGSGKTESTNFLLHHLTALSQKGSQGCGVEQTILSAGPVLEVRSPVNVFLSLFLIGLDWRFVFFRLLLTFRRIDFFGQLKGENFFFYL
jgi:hypothetical protein